MWVVELRSVGGGCALNFQCCLVCETVFVRIKSNSGEGYCTTPHDTDFAAYKMSGFAGLLESKTQQPTI